MRYLKTQFLIHVGCRNSNGQLDIEFKKHDQALTTNIDDLASQMDYVYVYMCMSQVSFGMPAKNNTMSADLHQHVLHVRQLYCPGRYLMNIPFISSFYVYCPCDFGTY